jgi:hypothetical protein
VLSVVQRCLLERIELTTEHTEKHGKNENLQDPSFNLCLGIASKVDQQPKSHSGGFQIVQELGLVLGCDLLDGL